MSEDHAMQTSEVRELFAPRTSMRGWVRVLLYVFLLFVFGGTATALQHARLQKIRLFRPYVDSLFLPRAEYVKALALGYDLFVADFLYLRAVQAFGGQWRFGIDDMEVVHQFFDGMTELDPQFMEAYQFGAMVIGEEGGDVEGSIKLNEKGWLKNPGEYRPAYENAYACYWLLKDPARAKYWARLAVRAANCPPWVQRFEAFFDRKQGNFEAAAVKWISTYIRAVRDGDNHLRTLAQRQLESIAEEWNLDMLNRALAEYVEGHGGQRPPDIETVAEILGEYRFFDQRRAVAILDSLDSTQIDDLEGLTDGISQTVIGPRRGVPQPPHSPEVPDGINRYFLRRDTLDEDFEKLVEEQALIFSTAKAKEYLQAGALSYVRGRVDSFKEEHGRWPESLEEVFSENKLTFGDPLAGSFEYDAETGKVIAPTFPDL